MQIIQVNLTSEDLQPITSGSKVEFTYSVTWAATPIQFNRRFERYLDYNFFEHQVYHTLLVCICNMQLGCTAHLQSILLKEKLPLRLLSLPDL